MSVQLQVDFEQLVAMVQQLSEEEQQRLIARVLAGNSAPDRYAVSEKMKMLHAAQLHREVTVEPSIRRDDWYGDDGRQGVC
jgi:hypothetical protein